MYVLFHHRSERDELESGLGARGVVVVHQSFSTRSST